MFHPNFTGHQQLWRVFTRITPDFVTVCHHHEGVKEFLETEVQFHQPELLVCYGLRGPTNHRIPKKRQNEVGPAAEGNP